MGYSITRTRVSLSQHLKRKGKVNIFFKGKKSHLNSGRFWQEIFFNKGIIKRTENEILLDSEFARSEAQNQISLLRLRYEKNTFWLYNINPVIERSNEDLSHQRTLAEKSLATDNSPWFVVRHHQTKTGYKIQEGDFLKLGRMKLKIYEINIQGMPARDKSPKAGRRINKSVVNIKKCQYLEETMERDEDKGAKSPDEISRGKLFHDERCSTMSCRICLGDNIEPDNPMISPCKCSGTMRVVHMKCLQTWLNSKILIKKLNNNCTTYNWKNFQCELCKNELDWFITHEGKKYELLQVSKPKENYIILEILGKEKNESKGMHILSLAGKREIKIGRGNDNDLKIPDISVSRVHAILRWENFEVFLEDCQSKFGSLVLMKNKVELTNANQFYALQIGRSFLHISLLKNSTNSIDICCSKLCARGDDNNAQSEIRIDQENFDELDNAMDVSNEEMNIENNDPLSASNVVISKKRLFLVGRRSYVIFA